MLAASVLTRLFRRADGDLVAAARGNASAIERFYEAHVDGLYAFVFHRVGRDAALAEDVVQETFSIALRRQDDYVAERGGVGAWLHSLSRNVIRDELRAHRRNWPAVHASRISASSLRCCRPTKRACWATLAQ